MKKPTRLFTFAVLLIATIFSPIINCAAAEGYAVRGWELDYNNEEHINRLLDLAPEYRINHIQLTHAILMNIDKIVDDAEARALIDRVSRRADDLGIGLCTPPVGSTLFVGCAIGKVRIEKMARSMWPFYIAMIAVLLLITYVPWFTMWLPGFTK